MKMKYCIECGRRNLDGCLWALNYKRDKNHIACWCPIGCLFIKE